MLLSVCSLALGKSLNLCVKWVSWCSSHRHFKTNLGAIIYSVFSHISCVFNYPCPCCFSALSPSFHHYSPFPVQAPITLMAAIASHSGFPSQVPSKTHNSFLYDSDLFTPFICQQNKQINKQTNKPLVASFPTGGSVQFNNYLNISNAGAPQLDSERPSKATGWTKVENQIHRYWEEILQWRICSH